MVGLTARVRRMTAQLRGDRGLAILVALFALLLPLATPRVYATDEVQYYVYLRSLRFDGDLDFANDYRRFAELNPRSGIEGSLLQPNRIRPATGLYGNIAPVGAAIMWAPFFLLADVLVHLANLFGARIPADGFSAPYIYAVCYASALYGLLGVLLSYRLARRFASDFAATLASATIWLASPLVFYMYIQMPFAHATGLFLTALFLTIWYETREWGRDGTTTGQERGWRAWLALGLVGGLMTMTREQLGLFLIAPAIEALWRYGCFLRTGIGSGLGRSGTGGASLDRSGTGGSEARPCYRSLGRLALRHALFVAAFVVAITPQLFVYQVLNGAPRPAAEVSGKLNWCSPHFIDTLIDFNPAPDFWCPGASDFTATFPPFSRGALIWSPALALGLAGLVLLWRHDRLLTVALTAAFLAQTWINGAFGTTWHLTGAFGFRRLIECTPIFVVGLALLNDNLISRIGRLSVLVPAVALIGWNFGLVLNATVFNAETNLRRGLTWPDVWRWQMEAPLRALRLIGDLLFRRCRFFENQPCE
ncbi:MAG: glycosyltransferase family 39 protein [Roseiflexus sp.]|nr:glycosyltransferase family 39 protein [Roseiflexus sp.]MCS7289591.1 glycosyltransferase family 39 protein [Roseiflexus sp.]MDW8148619.1 glycosyltransferase family 39 protein [Roseiflexaceae bacterium]MDW8231732.1 glycosyltransferase family 39 protein [Roseiflexaceae bacterium]